MKLFSFLRRKPSTAPAMINPPQPAAIAAPQATPSLLSILVLKVIQAFPNRGEDRALRRFFEKTSVAATQVLQCRQQLFEEGLLALGPVKQGVQYFVLSEQGRALLEKAFQLEAVLRFAQEIEPKGFIATLLRNVQEKEMARGN